MDLTQLIILAYPFQSDFLITIIFLIFDVEIALTIPIIKSFFISNSIEWIITRNLIIWILIIGLYIEWNNGALNWNN